MRRIRLADYIERVRPLLEAGFNDYEVADKLGISDTTVRRIRKKLKIAALPKGRPSSQSSAKSGSAKEKIPHSCAPKKIANMRMTSGKVERSGAIFYDRRGNPVSNAEVTREVEAGWRNFWNKRGVMPQSPGRKFLRPQ